MRKYFQITFFLGIFGVMVFLRQLKGADRINIVGENNNNIGPSPAATSSNPSPTTPQSNANPTSGMMLPTSMPMMGRYKNGTYTGSVQDAFYGNIQVQAVITNGKISDVIFLQYPNDNQNSQFINGQAMPLLKQEAIQAQSAQVDIVSGASASSQAFQISLADALNQAK